MEGVHRKPLFAKGLFPNRGFWFYWGVGVGVQLGFGFSGSTVFAWCLEILGYSVGWQLFPGLMLGFCSGGTGGIIYMTIWDYLFRTFYGGMSSQWNDRETLIWFGVVSLLQVSGIALLFARYCIKRNGITRHILAMLFGFMCANAGLAAIVAFFKEFL